MSRNLKIHRKGGKEGGKSGGVGGGQIFCKICNKKK